MSDHGRTESERWLSQAHEDLITTRVLVDAGRFYMACFVSQQSAEKALKAFLFFNGAGLVLGHSVARLCSECAVHDPEFAALRAEVKNLDHFYIEARYPNGLPEVTPAEFFDHSDADSALKAATEVLELVRKRLPGADSSAV